MWGTIHQLISHYIDQPFNDTRCRSVSGGDSHKAVVLSNGKQTSSLKLMSVQPYLSFLLKLMG